MLRTRYRSFYISAIAVAGLGLFGSAFVSRAHSEAQNKPAVIELTDDTAQDSSVTKLEGMNASGPLLGFAGLTALSLSGLLSLSNKQRA